MQGKHLAPSILHGLHLGRCAWVLGFGVILNPKPPKGGPQQSATATVTAFQAACSRPSLAGSQTCVSLPGLPALQVGWSPTDLTLDQG